MKLVRYVPKEAKGDDAKFEGYVDIYTLSADERLELAADGVDIDEDGEVTAISGKKKHIKYLALAVRLSRRKYKAVELRCKETGKEYKSYNDLEDDEKCQSMIHDIASSLLNGFEVGNG